MRGGGLNFLDKGFFVNIITNHIQPQAIVTLGFVPGWWSRCSLDCSQVSLRLGWPRLLRTSAGDCGALSRLVPLCDLESDPSDPNMGWSVQVNAESRERLLEPGGS